MKNIFFALLSLFSLYSHSQNDKISAEIPTILPPAPTVAALMKYEDVPVNNYTKVPDISIPLYNCQTLSNDIHLNIGLSYHPANAAANEAASDVCLGWSLNLGGTVSRTVRGLPDEQFIPQVKEGIYQTSDNFYYEYNGHWFDSYPDDDYAVEDFFYEASGKNTYDTEHDLWPCPC